MFMKPEQVKEILLTEIKKVADNRYDFCFNPKTDFTRNRKITLEKLMITIIGMKSGSLTNELLDAYDTSVHTPSASAFVQQRSKLKPEAFETVFRSFAKKLSSNPRDALHILAIDGSDVQIATDPKDTSSYFPGANGQKPYNLLHLNAMYDLKHHVYLDAIIQKRHDWNEHKAFVEMVDRSAITKALVMADRGYESYNNMAHVQEKGWNFLIRVKDGKNGIKAGLDLPEEDSFDVGIHLKLTRRQTKDTKELLKNRNSYRFISVTTPFDYLATKCRKYDPVEFYELHFRVVRFKISENTYETILTNLNAKDYPVAKIKELYASRWGIESSFRDLKYTLGMLDFHSKKVMCIQQEIFAHLIMYNFAEMITSHVAIEKKQKKYTYKANFSVAAHICRLFYYGKTSPPDLETIIARNLIPVRPDRHRKRNSTIKVFHGFLYRIA